MKLSKDELKQKISDSITDNDDLVIELLEDIEDSFPSDDLIIQMQAKYDAEKANLEAQIANEKAYYEELKAKYKERFLKGKEKDPDEKDPDEKNEGLEEKEVIDVKEI